jgi:hypothetical protein
MSDLYGKRTLTTVTRDAFKDLGERCHRDDLVEAVRHSLSMAEFQDWSDRAFRQAVLKATKRSVADAGADAAYGLEDGTVSTLRLFSVEDFEEKARQMCRQVKATREAIVRLAEVCQQVHGSTFDVDSVLAEERAA